MNATYLCAKQSGEYVYAYAVYKKSWDVFDLKTETIRSRTAFEIKESEYKRSIGCILDIGNIQNCNMGNQIGNNEGNRIGTDIHKRMISVR